MSLTIAADTRETLDLTADRASVWALLADVKASSAFVPDLEACEPAGDGIWKYRYKAVGLKGFSFQPSYTARFTLKEPDSIRWEAIEGNLRQSGSWTLSDAPGGGTRAELKIEVEAELPVPRLLGAAAKPLFTETFKRSVRGYLERIGRELG